MSEQVKTPPTLEALRARRDEILALAEQRGATNVRVFGSVARGEATPDSDIDLLMDFPPQYSLLRLSGLVRELQEMLEYSVDVTSAAHLRAELRDDILKDAVPL